MIVLQWKLQSDKGTCGTWKNTLVYTQTSNYAHGRTLYLVHLFIYQKKKKSNMGDNKQRLFL